MLSKTLTVGMDPPLEDTVNRMENLYKCTCLNIKAHNMPFPLLRFEDSEYGGIAVLAESVQHPQN